MRFNIDIIAVVNLYRRFPQNCSIIHFLIGSDIEFYQKKRRIEALKWKTQTISLKIERQDTTGYGNLHLPLKLFVCAFYFYGAVYIYLGR